MQPMVSFTPDCFRFVGIVMVLLFLIFVLFCFLFLSFCRFVLSFCVYTVCSVLVCLSFPESLVFSLCYFEAVVQ